MNHLKKTLRFALGLTLASALFGCAEERPPIDRVQPFALKKAYFVGDNFVSTDDDPEFWTQATLIDVGYGASQQGLFTSTYAQPVSRIKWEITEDLLIGRIAYERIDDSDKKGIGGATQDGIIAVAFRILKHFDIERAYNPTTGEKLNIVQENSFDRPWFERQHFRVDFSRNLNTDSYDFDTLSMLGVYGGISYEPMAFDITDPRHPDAPVFDLSNGYFDVTTKAFARPGMIDLSSLGWGIARFPACFLPGDFSGGTAPVGNCNPIELTLRHSFRRVEDFDYEPRHWDGIKFRAYGAFDVERRGYSRNYGLTDDKWRRFISRYNIWKRSHYYENAIEMLSPVECFTPETTPFGGDPHRDENGDGTEDECAAVGDGSRCDTFSQKCTLPYRQREVRPIVWYYTKQSDMRYFEGTRHATHEWDVALRTAVRAARYAECRKTNSEDCDVLYPMYPGQQDMNEDLIALALEVTNCRNGYAYPEKNRSLSACNQLADQIGEARGYHPAVIDIAKEPEMVVLCHSPVEADDHVFCGEERLPPGITAADCNEVYSDPWSDKWINTSAGDTTFPDLYETCMSARNVRMGDLRYHQVNVIEAPQTPSPWGIYTDSEDPLTGETISASINVWSWVNDYWAQRVVDKMRFLKGELAPDEITEGEYVRRWSEASSAAAGGGFSPGVDRDTLKRRVADFAGVDKELIETAAMAPELREASHKLLHEMQHVRMSLDAPSQVDAVVAARAASLHGTSVEAELMTPMMQEMTGVEGLPMSDAILDMSSPLRGANPTFARRLQHLKEKALGERGACIRHEAPAPLAMAGLADVLESKFGAFDPSQSEGEQQERAERMRKYIAQRAHTAVIMHEMGHSVGLRHNFVSSSDAMNYRPQYWQLRTRNGEVTEECDGLVADGTNCVGPRYFDPVTGEERNNLLQMFMHSSVMDYAGEITQDFMGLGAYDFAAARMFYGETVAVFADDDLDANSTKAFGILNKLDNFGGILGFTWFENPNSTIHYSKLNEAYKLIQNCRSVDPAQYVPAGWNDDVDGRWHPVLDGRMVAVGGKYTRCGTRPVDYVAWDQLSGPADSNSTRAGPSIDPSNRLRVPYGFGTDSWADTGNLAVFRHDNGADPYELFDFFIAKQEVDHIFTNYRRGRSTFSVRSAASSALGRFNGKMRDAAKGLGLYRNIFSASLARQGFNMDEAWPLVADVNFSNNILAASMAFDHFSRMLARPEHGPHYKLRLDEVARSKRDAFFLSGEPRTVITVPNGPTGFYDAVGIGGRPVENQLAEDEGEYNNQYTVNAGSYYEKIWSPFLFTESADNFISASRTDFVDPRYRAVSMADLFPDGFRRLLANNLTGDDFIKGPRVVADANGIPLVDAENYPQRPIGWISWWGSEPRVCFPNAGTTVCDTVGNENGPEFQAADIESVIPLDPQVGFEQQKFLIAWTLLYLPSNQKQRWLDMLAIWERGQHADPGFENRIEFHYPAGRQYIAKTYGTEEIFGKTVQKGIAARMLEYANDLLVRAYEVTDGPDLNDDGTPDWYIPVISDDGAPVVKYDSRIQPTDTCSPDSNLGCTCGANLDCIALADYVSLPAFLNDIYHMLGYGLPRERGIY
ncbi:MAG: zinc-dependent metalloprotease [Bradymonadia bacterium]